MADPVGQLEDRVTRVIDRLGGLLRERDALRQEVDRLRERLALLETQQTELAGARDANQDWLRERRRIAESLRATLHGLRVDPPGAREVNGAERSD